ncbi:Ldh family oxidoreductase [Streptacidiphilus sp. MAP5-3]|uniref:Ldh family oxidoreductase n=1 Tax=unclassified Streptacidiphilus TaxID=2643834 RepID=UPI0035179099
MPLSSSPLPHQLTQRQDSPLVDHDDLLRFTTDVFRRCGVARDRAATAAEALCYGDLTGMSSHGLTNLTRLYLPLFEQGRVDASAEPLVTTDAGAAVRQDARGALGLWSAAAAMDLAVERAARFGIGLVSVHGATHLGCAGYHAARAAHRGMVGIVASNCGRQRIARPPGGLRTLLGTNPLSIAAPAGEHHPFVLDMSTTVAPTSRVRVAARAGQPVPAGWLADDNGRTVTDAAAFDRGEAHLRWLGGDTETGGYKGFGLGLAVEVLAALVSGSGRGPEPEALEADGRPSGRDDDIGFFVAAVAPGVLRPAGDVAADAASLFGTVLDCPPADPAAPVRYPGWTEAERAQRHRADGVPVSAALLGELQDVAQRFDVKAPVVRRREAN